ncbi:calcium-activated potassium channel subunit beta-3 [Electrophorus electricus]|uniref:calcium-activated potassium channel subunit beta-3 n=1 Tax=Electrophorus electricus TaxID=8005 RepID=UPI000F0A72C8|nr:calcium-activated potassium channel subunit beta-3 [Electrophorus electricus]
MAKRHRRTHVLGEILQYPRHVQQSQWRRCRVGEKAKAQAVSSVGEERALLLGFTMMAFSILMYFVVGIVVVKPCLHSDWVDTTNCSIVRTELLNESDDCRSTSSYPCLLVFVNIIASGRRVRLHYDEPVVTLSPECFYTPKNQQDKTELLEEAQRIKKTLSDLQGQAMECHISTERYPEDAIMKRRYTMRLALQCLLWPTLMLAGGILLVGLVMLTQCLAHLCAEVTIEGSEDDETTAMQGRLYRVLTGRPGSPSIA